MNKIRRELALRVRPLFKTSGSLSDYNLIIASRHLSIWVFFLWYEYRTFAKLCILYVYYLRKYYKWEMCVGWMIVHMCAVYFITDSALSLRCRIRHINIIKPDRSRVIGALLSSCMYAYNTQCLNKGMHWRIYTNNILFTGHIYRNVRNTKIYI